MQIISDVNRYVRDVFLEYFKVSKLSGACLDALNEQDIELLETNRQALLKGSSDSYSNLRAITPYADDADFKNKGLAYVTYFKVFAQKDLVEVINILKNEARTNADIDKYNDIINQYNIDQGTLINNFNEANTKLMRTHIPNNTGGNATDGGKKG